MLGLDRATGTTQKTEMKLILGTVAWVPVATHMLPLVFKGPLVRSLEPMAAVALPVAIMAAMVAAIEALEMSLEMSLPRTLKSGRSCRG
jgi:hypothetical protein